MMYKEKLLNCIYKEQDYQISYALYVPPKEKGVSYSLFTFLHGSGERGSDLSFINDEMYGGNFLKSFFDNTKNTILLIPQCPQDECFSERVFLNNGGFLDLKTSRTKCSQVVEQLIRETIQKYDVDVFTLGGLSMGGFGVYEYLQRGIFKPYSASIICAKPDKNHLDKIINNRLYIYHGALDNVISPSGYEEIIETIKETNQVEYRLYDGVNHGSWINAFNDPDFFKRVFR